MNSLDDLHQLLAERSAQRGQFTLSSGRESSLYIDARLTTMSPEGLVLIGELGLRALEETGWGVQAVGGLTLGADPVAYAISYASALAGRPIRAFTVRKEAKTHGTQQLIEGPFSKGDRVAVVEDVITTGASALRAAAVVREQGGKVCGAFAVVDRDEGGRAALEREGIAVVTLARITDIVSRMA